MKDLFEIEAAGEAVGGAGAETESVFEIRLNPSHRVFEGHFPSNPVLPGVCSLMILRRCASMMAGRRVSFAAIVESKFLALVTPDCRLTARLRITPAESGGGLLNAGLYHADKVMVKLKARLQ